MAAFADALMGPDDPWHLRVKEAALRFWHTENPRIAAVRDVGVAALVVLVLLGGIWAYTGQPFPSQAPLVVVESGSMMHGPGGPCLGGTRRCSEFDSSPFGRLGTIDPGDLVLVRDVDRFDQIETAFGHGERDGYGGHGDVIVYERDGASAKTPVIHRAMLLIEAEPAGCRPNVLTNPCTYRIPETCDAALFSTFVQTGSGNWRNYCSGSTQPITLILKRDGLFLSMRDYPCPASQQCPAFEGGFITKGDNNWQYDQPTPYTGSAGSNDITCCPVSIDFVVGKARGEIPWLGLVKLSLYGNKMYEPSGDPNGSPQWTIVRARAPWDTWVGLVVATAVFVSVPIGVDHLVEWIRKWRAERARGRTPAAKRPPSK